jgi:hypothetical protein
VILLFEIKFWCLSNKVVKAVPTVIQFYRTVTEDLLQFQFYIIQSFTAGMRIYITKDLERQSLMKRDLCCSLLLFCRFCIPQLSKKSCEMIIDDGKKY